MSHGMNTTQGTLRLLTTATLIRRFHEQCPSDELYDKAVRSYETLLEVRGKGHTAREIAELLNIPEVTIRHSADAIISTLIFNRKDDPFLSFGLKKNAHLSEVNMRWKKLIVLYHPDKHVDDGTIGRKVHKVNDMYDKIQRLHGQDVHLRPFTPVRAPGRQGRGAVAHGRHFRYLPVIIIALAATVAVLSILLFMWRT